MNRGRGITAIAPLVIVLLVAIQFGATSAFSLKDAKIWGPGLNVDFFMPTRYFYVQIINQDGSEVTESQGSLKVHLSTKTGGRATAAVKVYDRADGSYVVNIKVWTFFKDLVIDLTMDAAKDTRRLSIPGFLYQENCDCPMKNSDWLKALECSTNFPELDNDMEPFPANSVNMREVEKAVHERWPKRPGNGALMHYVVKDNKIYRKDVGSITGFKMFTDAFLQSLARKIRLPDVEFFINLGDWPLAKKKQSPLPILSWCGSQDTYDIILPTYDITDSALKSLGQVSLDILSIQHQTTPPWEQKISKGLFRGRDSRQERLDLVKMARKDDNNEYLDAGITAFFFFPKDESLFTSRVNFLDYAKYKYQINVDGTVAAYRFPYLLALDAVVLKQDSEYYEHFYPQLKPWVHYIPVKRDLSDVIEKIKWARQHDEEAQKIVKNAQQYAREKITPANIYCYYYRTLTKLAASLSSEVKVLEGMESPEPVTYMANCNCHRTTQSVKDEL